MDTPAVRRLSGDVGDGGERANLASLTSMRFLAALVVVLSHSTRDLAPIPIVSDFANAGTVGVGFFFALSGFVLTWSHRASDTPRRFYRRRVARVYPMHFLTYLLAFPVLLLAGTNMQGATVNWKAAVASPLLIQAWFPQDQIRYGMNAPSWSLSNEAFFYLLFPLVVPLLVRATPRVVRVALICLPVVVLLGTVVYLLFSTQVDFLYLNPAWRSLGFVAGALLALRTREGRMQVPSLRVALGLTTAGFLLLPAIGAVGSATGISVLSTKGFFDAVMLPLFLMLIAAGARSDLDETDRWIAHRRWVRLGEWSFSLYLTHWLLIDLILALFPAVRAVGPGEAVLANIVLVLLAIAVSGLFYIALERPLERRLRGARPRPEEISVRAEPA